MVQHGSEPSSASDSIYFIDASALQIFIVLYCIVSNGRACATAEAVVQSRVELLFISSMLRIFTLHFYTNLNFMVYEILLRSEKVINLQ